MDIKDQKQTILSKVAVKVNWKNYDVSTNIDYEKGNGFMGEFFLASIINKDTEEKLDLAVKCSFKSDERRNESMTPAAFQNEICFYDDIVPALVAFAEEKGVANQFNFVPKYYACIKEDYNECIAMENLRNIGYQCVNRDQLLDENHVNFVFQTYGRFHGFTFAFKDQKPKEFELLLKKGVDFFELLSNKEDNFFPESMRQATEEAFQNVNEDVKAACKDYIDNPYNILIKYYNNYEGKHSALIHGDCWSNNMMFQYKDSKVINMKLIDFQLFKDGTPVFDLSYFLYAGGSFEAYTNLEKYLKIYYDNFTRVVTQLGSNPKKLLPWEVLINDWKKYSKIGLLMGIFINKIKLMSNDDVQTLVDDTSFVSKMGEIKLNDELFRKFKNRCKNLIEHAYKEGFLELC